MSGDQERGGCCRVCEGLQSDSWMMHVFRLHNPYITRNLARREVRDSARSRPREHGLGTPAAYPRYHVVRQILKSPRRKRTRKRPATVTKRTPLFGSKVLNRRGPAPAATVQHQHPSRTTEAATRRWRRTLRAVFNAEVMPPPGLFPKLGCL